MTAVRMAVTVHNFPLDIPTRSVSQVKRRFRGVPPQPDFQDGVCRSQCVRASPESLRISPDQTLIACVHTRTLTRPAPALATHSLFPPTPPTQAAEVPLLGLRRLPSAARGAVLQLHERDGR